MPANSQPRTGRASAVPAYYLGRPADWWITATTRRVRAPEAAYQAVRAPSIQETR